MYSRLECKDYMCVQGIVMKYKKCYTVLLIVVKESDGNRIKSQSEEMAASVLELQNKLRAAGAFNPHASDR